MILELGQQKTAENFFYCQSCMQHVYFKITQEDEKTIVRKCSRGHQKVTRKEYGNDPES